jgi:hypothetical protein
MKQSEVPELTKMLAVKEQSQVIGEFIDWLNEEKGIYLKAKGYCPVFDFEGLLAEFFKIDLKKAEQEKQKILEGLRKTCEVK